VIPGRIWNPSPCNEPTTGTHEKVINFRYVVDRKFIDQCIALGLFYIFVGCDRFKWVAYPREQPSHHNQHDISNLKMRSARMLVRQTGHLQVDVIFGMMHL